MITLESITKYHAIKKVVQESLKYFYKNKDKAIVEIKSSFTENGGGEYHLIVRKEDLQYRVGYDFWSSTPNYTKMVSDKGLGHKKRVLEIFNYLAAMNNYNKLVKG